MSKKRSFTTELITSITAVGEIDGDQQKPPTPSYKGSAGRAAGTGLQGQHARVYSCHGPSLIPGTQAPRASWAPALWGAALIFTKQSPGNGSKGWSVLCVRGQCLVPGIT